MRHARTVLSTSMPFYRYTLSRSVSALVVAVLLALTPSSRASSSSSSDGLKILNLTTEDFDDVVAQTHHLFVEFCKYVSIVYHSSLTSFRHCLNKKILYGYIQSSTSRAFITAYVCMKEIMQGTVPGARRRGRPLTAWMDNIKTWTGLLVEESIRMTEKGDKWRKYVHGVANYPGIEDG